MILNNSFTHPYPYFTLLSPFSVLILSPHIYRWTENFPSELTMLTTIHCITKVLTPDIESPLLICCSKLPNRLPKYRLLPLIIFQRTKVQECHAPQTCNPKDLNWFWPENFSHKMSFHVTPREGNNQYYNTYEIKQQLAWHFLSHPCVLLKNFWFYISVPMVGEWIESS